MSHRTKDSYTHEPYVESYISPYKGINEPRRFYKAGTPTGAQYTAILLEDSRWLVTRSDTVKEWLPPFKQEATARAVMDFLVENDASVAIAIHWFNQSIMQPMFNLYDKIAEIIRTHG